VKRIAFYDRVQPD